MINMRRLNAVEAGTIFQLVGDIIGTNLLNKFHEDRKINVLTKTNAPPPGGHFHEDRTINVASIEKNAPSLGSHVFQANITIFELIQDIIETNLLTKFHEDWKINVASIVLTRKNAPPPDGHVFQPTGIIFDLIQDIIVKNLLTKFHEDRTINMTSRVLTRIYYSHIRKNATPLDSHVFQANVTIFELIQDIIETNLLTKFHEDWTIDKKNAQPPGGHAFQPTGIIFELIQDIIRINLLTKFHKDLTINMAYRVLTSHIKKNAPPLGSNAFQANETILELVLDIIEANLLTKFHKDWTINVASRVLTCRMLTPHGGKKGFVDRVIAASSRLPFVLTGVRDNKSSSFKHYQDIIQTNCLTKLHEDSESLKEN
ncbi:hypothetical protein DPMN_053924 [Dreissena polymorpha]|uniref:Uncharacterized protein n=1 Tax=Dreissena polymorpha TaxID=45954 RepID=A0A9D4HSN2_DREPO|nr:hypothetical protein DPMN_053924 [Dreissena polymorpha]